MPLKIGARIVGMGVLAVAGSSLKADSVRGAHTASSACTRPAAGASLAPASDHSRLAGGYQLTLVSEGPEHAGRRVAGGLWLWRGSAADSSPRTRKRVAPDDTVSHPYYGATNLDLWDLKRKGPANEAVLKSGIDPVYPQVLVEVLRGPAPSNAVWKSITLWIGSAANARDGSQGLDGAGFALDVVAIGPSGFRGHWGPAGIVRTEKGYFCAVRHRTARRTP